MWQNWVTSSIITTTFSCIYSFHQVHIVLFDHKKHVGYILQMCETFRYLFNNKLCGTLPGVHLQSWRQRNFPLRILKIWLLRECEINGKPSQFTLRHDNKICKYSNFKVCTELRLLFAFLSSGPLNESHFSLLTSASIHSGQMGNLCLPTLPRFSDELATDAAALKSRQIHG